MLMFLGSMFAQSFIQEYVVSFAIFESLLWMSTFISWKLKYIVVE